MLVNMWAITYHCTIIQLYRVSVEDLIVRLILLLQEVQNLAQLKHLKTAPHVRICIHKFGSTRVNSIKPGIIYAKMLVYYLNMLS